MARPQSYRTQGTYGVLRLKSKEARAAIIQKLASGFNLTPIIAEAFYQQFSLYFEEHANVGLSTGAMAYEAVTAPSSADLFQHCVINSHPGS